jgi:hypothetical protein
MIERLPLPPVVDKFEERGALRYSFFQTSSGDIAQLREAISRHFQESDDKGPFWRLLSFKDEVLDELPRRVIDARTFLGDRYDLDRKTLVLFGNGYLNGKVRENPTYAELIAEGVRSRTSSSANVFGHPTPETGSGGQYAYAFTQSPHGLGLGFADEQALFDEINQLILPPGEEAVITDWSSEKLGELCDYFEDGLEWWGVFLFTIYVPRLGQLVVISASATD